MKKYITLLCVIVSSNILVACDFCGCFMGITPYDNQSSITMIYRYKSFNGYNFSGQHNNLFPKSYTTQSNTNTISNYNNQNYYKHGGHTTPAPQAPIPQRTQDDYEIYTTAELRARFFIHHNIELNAIIPFVMNSSKMDDKIEHIEGIGDLTFFAGFHVINKTMTEKFQHRLILGAGVKLPVGDYYAKNESGERIDFLMQPGTGSIDYMAYFNYVFGYKKIGLSLNSTYKINGSNYYHEKINNSTSNYLNIFYKFRQDKNLKIFPSLQAYYEHTDGEYIDDVYQPATRMSVATAGIGIDVFYKHILVNTSFHMPVYEYKIEVNMATAGKFMIGITYNFNQKNYLLKSKKQS